jgi:hypothetical protein
LFEVKGTALNAAIIPRRYLVQERKYYSGKPLSEVLRVPVGYLNTTLRRSWVALSPFPPYTVFVLLWYCAYLSV